MQQSNPKGFYGLTRLGREGDPSRIVKEIEISLYNQIVHAQISIRPRKWDPSNCLGFCDTKRSPNANQKTKPSDDGQKKI